jgi:hypothetical protein
LDTPYSVHRGLYGSPPHGSSTKSTQFARSRERVWESGQVAFLGNDRRRSTTKCTEPVAPSSGFPTDRRRTGCHSESHQPRTLRTRCIADSRGPPGGPSRHPNRNFSQIAIFSFRNGQTATRTLCSRSVREEKRPSAMARPQRFAEPGTLSSTFPTNLPLPRSAPRGASSYRRPVLGAGRNLGHRTCPIKGVRARNFAQIAPAAEPGRRYASPGIANRSRCASSNCSSSSSVPIRTGPWNRRRAQRIHQPPKSRSAPAKRSGA